MWKPSLWGLWWCVGCLLHFSYSLPMLRFLSTKSMKNELHCYPFGKTWYFNNIRWQNRHHRTGRVKLNRCLIYLGQYCDVIFILKYFFWSTQVLWYFIWISHSIRSQYRRIITGSISHIARTLLHILFFIHINCICLSCQPLKVKKTNDQLWVNSVGLISHWFVCYCPFLFPYCTHVVPITNFPQPMAI